MSNGNSDIEPRSPNNVQSDSAYGIDSDDTKPIATGVAYTSEYTNGLNPTKEESTGVVSADSSGFADGPTYSRVNAPTQGSVETNSKFCTNTTNVTDSLEPQSRILVWTAADKESTLRAATDCIQYLSRHKKAISQPGFLDDLAYTLSCRRTNFNWRSFATVHGSEQLMRLDIAKPSRSIGHLCIIFAFTGQGAQYRCMGLQLLAYSAFHTVLKEIDDILLKLGCKWTVLGESKYRVLGNQS